MFRQFKELLYPIIDPPLSQRQSFPRSLTRDRTPNGVDEYVLTTEATQAALSALEKSGFVRHEFPTTLKYVVQDNEVIFEYSSHAKGRYSRKPGESMIHVYTFPAKDGGLHFFMHSEHPLTRPEKHQNGSRTHGDPDNILKTTFQDAGIGYSTDSPQLSPD